MYYKNYLSFSASIFSKNQSNEQHIASIASPLLIEITCQFFLSTPILGEFPVRPPTQYYSTINFYDITDCHFTQYA